MKKNSCLLLILVIAVMCFSACSSDNNSTKTPPLESSNDLPSQTQNSEVTSSETSNPPSEDTKLDGVAYVGGRSITINYNDSRRKDTKSDSIVFHSQMNNIIALTYDKNISFSGTVDEVFEILNDGDLFSDISSYAGSAFSGGGAFEIKVESSEKKNISGFDTINITGNVVDSNGKTGVVYAYTFVVDKTPCMIVGIVIDETANAGIVSSMKNEVDNMAQTIREE